MPVFRNGICAVKYNSKCGSAVCGTELAVDGTDAGILF